MAEPPRIQIPDLEVLDELGRGAHSIVYRARRDQTLFAVKVLRLPRVARSSSSDSEEASPRARLDRDLLLRREGATLARIHHPSLAAVMEVNEAAGRVYVVMEYIAGGTLTHEIERGDLSEQRAVAIARDIAGALDAIHRQGLIHRDIKPPNILVQEDGTARLIDLGLAAPIQHEVDADSPTIAGTFLYAAPEQSRTLNRPVDGRADLYALGAVLFEMMTHHPPFRAANLGDLLHQHATVQPPLDLLDERCSPALRGIIARLLAKDPDDRYQAGDLLLHDLERLDALNAANKKGLPIELRARALFEGDRVDVPLVGRQKELGQLRRHWENVTLSKSGGIVVLRGSSGSGKSRLLRELCKQVRRGRSLLLQGRCQEDDPTPFAPLRRALEDYLKRLERSSKGRRQEHLQHLQDAAGQSGALIARFSQRLAAALGPELAASHTSDEGEQFYNALSLFFLKLASLHGSALIVIDDVQWLDDASRDLMHTLALESPQGPLMLLMAARDEDLSAKQRALLDKTAEVRLGAVTLAPLGDGEIEELICNHLGNWNVDRQVIRRIQQRSGGNAFATREYVHAMLDTGLLRPSWGRWVADPEGLRQISLPEDVLQLVVQRLNELAPEVRGALQMAALIGASFRTGLLAAVCEQDEGDVNRSVLEAVQARLIELVDGRTYAFVHDRVREALLHELLGPDLPRKHQRIAHALAARDDVGADPEHVYALAHHFYLGTWSSPKRAFAANQLAGRTALMAFAFERAHQFFEHATKVAERANIVPDADFEEGLAEACARTGRVGSALQHFQNALDKAQNPEARAKIHVGLAKLHLGRLNAPAATEQGTLALRELGVKAPARNGFTRIATLLHYILARLFRRRPAKTKAVRQRHALITETLVELSLAAYFEMRPAAMLLSMFAARITGERAGPSRALANTLSGQAAVWAVLGRTENAAETIALGKRVAEQIGDPSAIARAHLYEALVEHFAGRTTHAVMAMEQTLLNHGRWLENANYLTGCADLAWNLLMRGYAREAYYWIEQGLTRAKRASEHNLAAHGHTYRCYAGPALAAIGRQLEGLKHLDEFEALIAETPHDKWRWGQYLSHKALFYLVQGEIGAPLEEVIAAHAKLRLKPSRTPQQLKHFYVAVAWARLWRFGQLRGHAEEREAEQKLKAALRALEKAASHPTLEAHLRAIKGARLQLMGQHNEAERCFVGANQLARSSDNPWVLAEVARLRARRLRQLGHEAATKREAQFALRLAMEHGWSRLIQTLRREFDLTTEARGSGRLQLLASVSDGDVLQSTRFRRRLDALLQVSLASTAVLDPREHARAALDEIVRILGAERAFLFILDDADRLRLEAGRSSNGEDLADTGAYSRTVLDQVREARSPVVFSGAEEGPVSGAASVLTHGLRSILAAPLSLRDRLVGIVYLDSRLARGVFTDDDVEILVAMANHIAIALETLRAARVEAEFEGERAQRQLAEKLGSFAASLNQTLELQRLADLVSRQLASFIRADRAAVLERDGDKMRVLASSGYLDDDAMRGKETRIPTSRMLVELVDTGAPVLRRANGGPLDHPFEQQGTRSMLLSPLIARKQVKGALLVETLAGDPLGPHDAEISVTLANQAATALENARLFRDVEEASITDALTGCFNRRYLIERIEYELSRCQRHPGSFTLLMVDIDYFKRVNDSHGHAAGDAVLQQVVAVLSEGIRDTDLVGRYGGEEFVVLLVETELKTAELVAERLRHGVETLSAVADDKTLHVTISLGVAAFTGHQTVDAMLACADRALYKAKDQGRNRVVVDCPGLPSAARERK